MSCNIFCVKSIFLCQQVDETVPHAEEGCVKLGNRSTTYLFSCFSKCLKYRVQCEVFHLHNTRCHGASGDLDVVCSMLLALPFLNSAFVFEWWDRANLSVDKPAILQVRKW